jgi:hypothetical protein
MNPWEIYPFFKKYSTGKFKRKIKVKEKEKAGDNQRAQLEKSCNLK